MHLKIVVLILLCWPAESLGQASLAIKAAQANLAGEAGQANLASKATFARI